VIRQTNWWQLGGKKPSLYRNSDGCLPRNFNRAQRRRRLTTGPLEFREDRVDLQGKVKTALPA
jgi:hypothetical protein